MKILFFQHGDYADAYIKLGRGEKETYRQQQESVEFVANLTDRYDVTILCAGASSPDTELAPRLRSFSISEATAFDYVGLARYLADLSPDLIVCRSVNAALLKWVASTQVPTLVSLADTFANDGFRSRWRNSRIAKLIRAPSIPCVANHSLRASLSVRDILRYPADRIVPWDWRPLTTSTPRPAGGDGAETVVFYAGRLSEAKGVDDCLAALRLLRAEGLPVRFEFAGNGDFGHWRGRAEKLGVAEAAAFLGTVPNEEVRDRLRRAAMAVVPSRHDYPEGLPNGIYESLAAGTPLIVSDHPAFKDRLNDGRDWLVFPAGDAAALADRIRRLISDKTLYRTLSENAAAAHDRLYVGMVWMDLIRAFLADPGNRTGWVGDHSLASMGYR